MFRNIADKILKYINPSIIFPRLRRLITAWQDSDIKDRGVFVLVFAPTMLAFCGVIYTIISFVLFALPAFIIGMLSWILLAVVFGAGGEYLYEKLTGHTLNDGESVFSVEWRRTSYSEPSGSSSSSSYTWSGKDANGMSDPQTGGDDNRSDMHKKWFGTLKDAMGKSK